VSATTPFRLLAGAIDRDGGRIAALAEDVDGTIWAGSELGLLRIGGVAGAERIEQVGGPPDSDRVLALAADPGGGLWLAYDAGLFHRARDGAFRFAGRPPPDADDPNGINDLWIDTEDRLWLTTREGLCVLPLGRGGDVRFERRVLETAPAVTLARLGSTGAGCAGIGGGLPRALSPRTIRALADGRGLVASAGGVVELSGGRARVTYLPAADHRLEPTVALAADDGTLWIGTRTAGLLRLAASGLVAFGAADNLAGNLSTLALRGDEMIVVTDFYEPHRRVLRFVDGRFVDVTPPDAAAIVPHFAWGATSALGDDGVWWVTSQRGLLRHRRLAGGVFGPAELVRPAAIAEQLDHAELFRVFVARDGGVWVSGDAPPTVFRVEPATGEGRAFVEVAEFGRGGPTAIAESPGGDVWLGFYRGGVARLRGDRFEPLGDETSLPRGFVYRLSFDRRGRLWVATAGSGLVRIDEPDSARPVARQALPGSELDILQVYDVAEDLLGRTLAATARGVAVLDEAAGAFDTLTSADGLPVSWASALGTQPDGTVWIGTERGVARWRPAARRSVSPPIRILGLAVGGRQLPLAIEGATRIDGVVVSPADRTIEIAAVSPHLGAGAGPRYAWRVGGSEWSAPSGDRRLRLAGPAPGRMVIEARAVSSAGLTSSAPAVVVLDVLPPLWRRWWFVAAVAGALAGALAVAYRLRVARLLALERVRTRIAADLHDDLGSSLSRISILAEVARRQGGAENAESTTLDEIGRTARELAEMAGDIVWAIDPLRDDLGSLVSRLRRFGSDLFEPAGVRFAIVAPADAAAIQLGAAERRDLYLLLKEGLNNAAKYAQATRVSIAVAAVPEGLRVELVDDGRGFDSAAPERAVERGGGHGLRSMRERAARLGGRLAIERVAGGGTRLKLTARH
jgi:signal transduction histidine kinase/streptogramin lyase